MGVFSTMIQLTYKNDSATIRFLDGEVTLYQKSRWVRSLFGALGHAMAKEKERLHFHLSDITAVAFEEKRVDKLIYRLTLKDGQQHTFVFRCENDLTDALKPFLTAE